MFQALFWIGFAGTLLATMGHYAMFGPRHKGLREGPRNLRRMSLLERAIHLSMGVSFFALGITGFIAAVILKAPLSGWLRAIHMANAPLFAVSVAMAGLLWADHGRFAGHDWGWVKRFGGYLGGEGDVPAGRFNAGQKSFFWFVLFMGCVVVLSGLGRAFPVFSEDIQKFFYVAHRYASLGFFLAVISHIYLGTLANPGTLQVMISGRVSAAWAEHHHPLWWEDLRKRSRGPSDSRF